jgi:hypothetical protein
MDSSNLIEHITNVYANCRSFEDSGSLREVKIESGETNVSDVAFHMEFVRGHAYRLELHSETSYGIGPYSLIYYWDGRKWSSYDSIDLHDGDEPEHTNANEGLLIGSGWALSHGLFPDNPRLLKIKEYPPFAGFYPYNSATVAIDTFQDRPVYRLTLFLKILGVGDATSFWVDPHSYLILRERANLTIDTGDGGYKETTIRDTLHSPKLDSFATNKMIEFSPPAWTLPVIRYGGGNGSSPQEAVIIEGVSNEDAAFEAEIEWRGQHYPEFEFDDQDQINSNGKRYNLTQWTNSTGQTNTVYFEIRLSK